MPADVLASIEVVRATWRDVGALVKLDRRCFKPIDAYAWYEFLGLCLWPGVLALKALSEGRLVGFIAGDPRKQDGHTIIVTLAVDPKYQRRGIGERLLREVEARSTLPRLQLMVRKSNLPALHLYRKLNYAIVETWPHYYEDGEDAYVMEKTLTPNPLPIRERESRSGG
ncbi:diamine N-acetyltransferase [Thermoflexales bacterium]|nr:diamine N-acetyltransferase [Thermoflexales bacterium]